MQMEASGEVVEVVTEEVTTSLVEPPEEVTTKAPVEKVTPELTKEPLEEVETTVPAPEVTTTHEVNLRNEMRLVWNYLNLNIKSFL